jgi:hypothetical protein
MAMLLVVEHFLNESISMQLSCDYLILTETLKVNILQKQISLCLVIASNIIGFQTQKAVNSFWLFLKIKTHSGECFWLSWFSCMVAHQFHFQIQKE